MELALLAALTIVSITCPAVTIALARKWRQKQENHFADIRKKLIDDLAKAKAATETERRRLAVMQSEMYLDTQMLQLACQELALMWDEELQTQCYEGDWRIAKKYLKDLVMQHNRSWNREQNKQLAEAYKVRVDPA